MAIVSCDYHIRCVTCGDTLEFQDANHAVGLMRYLIANAKLIGTIDEMVRNNPTVYNVELMFGRWCVDTSWFYEHSSHALVPIDEYGRIPEEK